MFLLNTFVVYKSKCCLQSNDSSATQESSTYLWFLSHLYSEPPQPQVFVSYFSGLRVKLLLLLSEYKRRVSCPRLLRNRPQKCFRSASESPLPNRKCFFQVGQLSELSQSFVGVEHIIVDGKPLKEQALHMFHAVAMWSKTFYTQ